jgi:PKD repeat protein
MKKAYFFLFVVAVLCAGCKPDVESCFTFTISHGTVTFSSSCSIEAVAYTWEFGDGETSIAESPSHTYTTSGSYTVTLQVTDKKGNVASASELVTVDVEIPCVPSCVNGDCVNGTCLCDSGWGGMACDSMLNVKFSGTYNLTETCDASGTDAYAVTVTPSSTNLLHFSFNGLYRVSAMLTAVLDSTGTSFTIPATNIGPGTIESNGFCNANSDGSTINVSYRFSNGPAVDNCTAVLVRQ